MTVKHPEPQATLSATPAVLEVAVADSLRKPDPIVRMLRDALKENSGYNERVGTHREGLPDVSVHRSSIPRVLRVVDAAVKAAKKLGYEFRTHERLGRRSLHVVVEGEPVAFGVREKFRQERIPPAKGAPGWDRGTLVYHPTGLVSFGLGHTYSTAFRRSIGDTSKTRIEDRVGEFIVALSTEAAKQREDHEQARQSRLAFEREQEAKRAAARARALEKARRVALEAQADALDTSRRVSALVDEVERRAAAATLSDEEAEALAGWVRWAREHAGRLDPLAHGLPPWPDPVPEAPPAWWAR